MCEGSGVENTDDKLMADFLWFINLDMKEGAQQRVFQCLELWEVGERSHSVRVPQQKTLQGVCAQAGSDYDNQRAR